VVVVVFLGVVVVFLVVVVVFSVAQSSLIPHHSSFSKPHLPSLSMKETSQPLQQS